MIEATVAINAISSVSPAEFLQASSGSQQISAAGFSQMVGQGFEQVNQQMLVSQTEIQQLAVGNVQNLHQIMIGLEETKISFQLLMQVRNRMLEAYQDVMKMQV